MEEGIRLSEDRRDAPWSLSINDWAALEQLHHRWSACPDWPREVRDRRAWDRLIESWQIGCWLGDAAVAVAVSGGEPLGYAAVTMALDGHPSIGRAVEIGTFIAPPHRGTGLNAHLKRWAQAEATRLGAEWLVACIPVDNARASRAFRKVFPHAIEYNGTSDSSWHAYWKRRSFDADQPIRLFAVRLYADLDKI